MSSILKVKNIRKSYGKYMALDNISFELEENKIYGLLGRNGAGKTTLLNIIATHIFQTAGEVRAFEKDPLNNAEVMSKICYVKEFKDYNKSLRVEEILTLAAMFFPSWDKSYCERLISRFDIDAKKKFKQLSKGMQSALGIIIGLSSRAPVTIYDEPYLGLDAYARQLFYDELIEDYTENPRTIVISTHLINEVSNIIEQAIVLEKGKLISFEEVEAIKERSYSIIGRKEIVEKYICGKKVINTKQIGGMTAAAILDSFSREELLAMEKDGVDITSLTLQEVFVYMTGNKGDEEYAS